jgi:ABC-type glycerol-3-phosphate transport system substrate-binding protein
VHLRLGGTFAQLPSVVTRFNAAQKAVRGQTTSEGLSGYGKTVLVQPLPQDAIDIFGVTEFEPLDAALRQDNFDPTILGVENVKVFARNGHQLALPFTVWPWGLRWREDVFAAANVSPPSSTWTLEDFEGACCYGSRTLRWFRSR